MVDFEDVFSKNDSDLGRTGLTKHKIDVGYSTPMRQPIKVPLMARREEAAKANRVKAAFHFRVFHTHVYARKTLNPSTLYIF